MHKINLIYRGNSHIQYEEMLSDIIKCDSSSKIGKIIKITREEFNERLGKLTLNDQLIEIINKMPPEERILCCNTIFAKYVRICRQIKPRKLENIRTSVSTDKMITDFIERIKDQIKKSENPLIVIDAKSITDHMNADYKDLKGNGLVNKAMEKIIEIIEKKMPNVPWYTINAGHEVRKSSLRNFKDIYDPHFIVDSHNVTDDQGDNYPSPLSPSLTLYFSSNQSGEPAFNAGTLKTHVFKGFYGGNE